MRLRDQAFLSHAGGDSLLGSVGLTSTLYRELRDNRKLLAFYDVHSIQAGDPWRKSVELGVRSSKVVVVVLTPKYFSRCDCLVL